MTCDECNTDIKVGKPMVSVGQAGASRHMHFHGRCFTVYMQRKMTERDARKQHIAESAKGLDL